MKRPVTISFIFLAFWFLYGCSDQGAEKNQESMEAISTKIEKIDKAGFDRLVQKRNGQVLLVNVWATWCVPCRDEFPDLVKIAHQYENQEVEVVGISADFPDEIESKIRPFLKSQDARFTNYVKNFEDDGDFINSVNPEWSGALPATFIYDENGILQESHFGQTDFEGFRNLIELVRKRES